MLAVKMYYVDKMRIKNIADILTYSKDSISRWIKLYDDGSLDGLRDRPKSGRPLFISYDALKKIILKECEKKLIVSKTLLELVCNN